MRRLSATPCRPAAIVGGADSVRDDGRIDPGGDRGRPEESVAVTEETFGPLLVVNRVLTPTRRSAANATGYGPAPRCSPRSAARRSPSGCAAGWCRSTAWISFAGIPALLFGGVGESGWPDPRCRRAPRVHRLPIARQRFAMPIVVTSFRWTAKTMQALLGDREGAARPPRSGWQRRALRNHSRWGSMAGSRARQ
ncbi:hypothetical protein HBB16_14655 [Pseudonocardia sp. MCCB 268]|nr:hypothetical protein [Pseudonocardia cytotoxica]